MTTQEILEAARGAKTAVALSDSGTRDSALLGMADALCAPESMDAILAAIVTCCIKADLLVLLSDIDGLYTANPYTHPDAKLIPLVEDITPEVMALADGAGSALGTGGMSTKLRAARMVTSSGADMVIANGAHPELLYDIAEGRAAGTRFAAHRQEA